MDYVRLFIENRTSLLYFVRTTNILPRPPFLIPQPSVTLHHETTFTYHHSSAPLVNHHRSCPVQHRHAASGTPQGSAPRHAAHKQTYTPSNLPLTSPRRTLVITSPYGYRSDPFTRKSAFHSGIDLRANYEPAYAITYGEVIHVGYDNRSGLFVTIRHGSITLSYCHLSQSLVTKGSHVRPGTPIAITGNSGSRSTGPHLHLTLKDTKKDEPSTRPSFSVSLT